METVNTVESKRAKDKEMAHRQQTRDAMSTDESENDGSKNVDPSDAKLSLQTKDSASSSDSGRQSSSNCDMSTAKFDIEGFRQMINVHPLSVVIVGGSGHLTRSEVLPNLFTLFTRKLLPQNITIIGYARTKKTDDDFRKEVKSAVESKIVTDVRAVIGEDIHERSSKARKGSWLANAKAFLTRKKSDAKKPSTEKSNEQVRDNNKSNNLSDRELVDLFISRCFYRSGQYSNEEDFRDLNTFLQEQELLLLKSMHNQGTSPQTRSSEISANRLWHLAIPPSEFEGALKCIHALPTPSPTCFQRIAIEKPFGENSESAKKLNDLIRSLYDENHIFRVDHFLEKEWVQQLLVLRFANPIFSKAWSNENIAYIVVSIKETKSVEGRGQYFDQMGILGDMIQNHLLQILSIITAEESSCKSVHELHKTDILRAIKPLTKDDVVVGQYQTDNENPGYQEEESVPDNSNAETQTTAVVYINNDTWKGVPVILNTGKGLDSDTSQLRIVFKSPESSSMYAGAAQNEILVDLSDYPHLALTVNKKRIGISFEAQPINLTTASDDDVTPMKAYERMFLDLLRGDHNRFVKGDEAEATWKIVDGLMRTIRAQEIHPLPYKFGTPGPEEINQLLEKHNVPLTREDL